MSNGVGLLQVAREKMRPRHLAYRTEQGYLQWIRRYVRLHQRRASPGTCARKALSDS
jgi:hypothetical protein